MVVDGSVRIEKKIEILIFQAYVDAAPAIVAHGQKTTTHADLKFETLITIKSE